MPGTRRTFLQATWLPIHMQEKPQAKDYPEDDEGQAAIMDYPFLLLLLCFDFRRYHRFEGHSIAYIFDSLVTVVVTLWHL